MPSDKRERERRVRAQFVKAQCKHKGTVHKESPLLKETERAWQRVWSGAKESAYAKFMQIDSRRQCVSERERERKRVGKPMQMF